MKIKAEHKDKVVTWTTPMGVTISKTLGELTKADKNFLDYIGYNFDGLVELPKPRKKKESTEDESNGAD